MKKVFVKTKNVKQLISMMNRLREREDGVPGMGLVYGEPGLGKTYAITWWAAQNDAILIRSANLMSARWLLETPVNHIRKQKRTVLAIYSSGNKRTCFYQV